MSWPICESDIGGEDLLVTRATATATGSAEDVMGSCTTSIPARRRHLGRQLPSIRDHAG